MEWVMGFYSNQTAKKIIDSKCKEILEDKYTHQRFLKRMEGLKLKRKLEEKEKKQRYMLLCLK